MDEELLEKLSKILKDKNIDINQVVNGFSQSSEACNDNGTNSSAHLDMDTILKMQKLFSLLKSSDSSNDENLLLALKPYMRDGRKDKIDQYIKYLHIFSLYEKFQEMGGNLSDFL